MLFFLENVLDRPAKCLDRPEGPGPSRDPGESVLDPQQKSENDSWTVPEGPWTQGHFLRRWEILLDRRLLWTLGGLP